MKYNSNNIEFQWHSTRQLILTFQAPMEMVNELNTLFDELTTIHKLPKINETLVGKIDNEYSLYLNHTEPDGTPSKDNHNFMPPDILKWLEDRIHQYLQFNFIEHRGTKTHSIWINDYKAGELNKIFQKKIIDAGWSLKEDVPDSWFEPKMDTFKFYGRDMETLFSKTKIAHSRRVFCKSKEELLLI